MKTAIIAIVTAIVVGAAAFFGGMLFGQNRATQGLPAGLVQRLRANGQTGGQFPGGPNGQNGASGRTAFRGGTVGEVLAFDGKTMTVKLDDGGSRLVYLSSDTRITRSEDATSTDLKVGERVIVAGQPGDSGDVTARSVQIVPEGFSGLVPPQGGGPASQ